MIAQLALISEVEQFQLQTDHAANEADLLDAMYVAVDIETDTLWRGEGPQADFGLSYCAPVTRVALTYSGRLDGKLHTLVYKGPGYDLAVLKVFRAILNDENRTVIAHNAVFDLRALAGKYNFGRVRCLVWDTQAIAYIIHPDKQRFFSLEDTAEALGLALTPLQAKMKPLRAKLHTQPDALITRYVADDTELTYQIFSQQMTMINSTETMQLVNWENRASREYCEQAATGLVLNVPYVQEEIKRLATLLKIAKEALAKDGLVDTKPNLLREYLYVTKAIPVPDYEPFTVFYTDKVKTAMDTLLKQHSAVYFKVDRFDAVSLTSETILLREQTVQGRGHKAPVSYTAKLGNLSVSKYVMKAYIGVVLAEDNDDDGEFDAAGFALYAEQLKALRIFVLTSRKYAILYSLLDHAAFDGRVHSLISNGGTRTSRRSSSHPQLQNLPFKSDPDNPAGDMSGVLTGSPGFTLLEIDLNNAENRAAACIAGDDAMAAACLAGDFHAAMAAVYFGEAFTSLKPGSERWEYLRYLSKRITFGTAYGMGAVKLAGSLDITLAEAYAILKAKDIAYPAVARAKGMYSDMVKAKGFIKLWTHRPVMISRDYAGWNGACQGWVAEMVKRSIVEVNEHYRERGMMSRAALDMHDAIVFEIAHGEWPVAVNMAIEVMEHTIPDKLNQRTEPPMQWIARPDVKKNANKWGRYQLHPGDDGFVVSPNPVKPQAKTEPVKQAAAAKQHQEGREDQRKILQARNAALSARFDELDKEFAGPYPFALPVVRGTEVTPSPLHEFDLMNYVKVPLAWLQVTAKFDSLDSFVAVCSYTPQELQTMHLTANDRLAAAHRELRTTLASIEETEAALAALSHGEESRDSA